MNGSRYNEAVVYMVRHTGWSLEYIRKMPVDLLHTFVEELKYQGQVEDYNKNHLLALILTALTKDTTVEDILGPAPKRPYEEVNDIWQLAEKIGIRIPSLRT